MVLNGDCTQVVEAKICFNIFLGAASDNIATVGYHVRHVKTWLPVISVGLLGSSRREAAPLSWAEV